MKVSKTSNPAHILQIFWSFNTKAVAVNFCIIPLDGSTVKATHTVVAVNRHFGFILKFYIYTYILKFYKIILLLIMICSSRVSCRRKCVDETSPTDFFSSFLYFGEVNNMPFGMTEYICRTELLIFRISFIISTLCYQDCIQ